MSTHTSEHHHGTAILKEIAVDYRPEVCLHKPEDDEIHITFDHRGGARWRSHHRFQYGTFGGRIKCPAGNTSGLNFNIYLSSLEGDKSQDEIDFEFLGKDKLSVQTNVYTVGCGNREQIHPLGFDYSDDFHEYLIKWSPQTIEWLVDGKLIRKEERKPDEAWPEKPMFLYSSVWDASYIDEGRWTGNYVGCDAPYVCSYRNVRVPVENIILTEEEK
ncbi:putative xyloglucan endotransglucosylase/hydrolase protein 31 [Carex littledalei]|uniref:Putative xyloglucan endotransglucosylase/hydrolase protein 31 n=1 Tax=Carex littledalei TaxID=544730 RepID=A0A833QJY7_9POAL|nr:putative xyloglucan endotransglucosylase/hydrolase protein 31 [Carex littledalei]